MVMRNSPRHSSESPPCLPDPVRQLHSTWSARPVFSPPNFPRHFFKQPQPTTSAHHNHHHHHHRRPFLRFPLNPHRRLNHHHPSLSFSSSRKFTPFNLSFSSWSGPPHPPPLPPPPPPLSPLRQIQLPPFGSTPSLADEMEGADEKMAALKKAYADVLLNTATESAARILASESKAARFQQNLAVSKDEAIGTLLRMKSIMDAKINEADTISVGQKSRICELECQLNEAEHTIAFLKTELKRVNDEMEKKKSTPSKELGIQMKGQDTCIEDSYEENKPILLQCRVSSGTADIMPTSDLKSLDDKSQASGDHCCDNFENSLKLKSRKEAYSENNCSGNADLASLLIRRKEPELYRNGCTQRIRALEQNVVTGKGQRNRQFPKTVSVVCKNEKPPNPCLAASCMGNSAVDCSSGPNGTESKIGNYKPDQIGNFQYRYSSRKPRSRPTRRTISASISSKDAVDQETQPGHLKDELPKTDINTSDIYLCTETMKEIDKDSASPANSALHYVIPTGSNIQNTEAQNLLCNGEQVVSSSGQNSTEISDVSNCKMGLEMTGVRLEGSDLKDAKVCESNGAPTKVTSERLLKYTFQRKRMKGSSTNTNEDIHPDKKNTLKRKLSDTMNVPAEPQKPSEIVQSSRESRRIAQVARQLISLSEKRW